MNIKKIIKIFIFIVMISYLTANYCYAQEIIPKQPENIEKPINPEMLPQIKPDETITQNPIDTKAPPAVADILKKTEPPKEVPKDPRPERAKDANPNKPDICGNIIFDLTEKEQPISLKDALAISMEKNFDIKIFEQKAEKNKWNYYGTIANFLPDIDPNMNLQKNKGEFIVNTIIPDQVTETALQLNLDYYYFVSIKKYFNLQVARNDYKSQKKQLEYTKDQVLKDSAIKYYELLESKRGIEILKTNIDQIKEQLRINKEKQEAGIGTKFDVLRAEADLARANQSLTLAENIYRLDQAQLANIIGLPVFIQLVPDDDDIKIKEIFKNCFNLEQAKEIAMSTRPDLQAAKFDIEAAKQKRNSSYSNYIPDIALFGQYARQGTGQSGYLPNQIYGIAVGWNLSLNDISTGFISPAGLGLGLMNYTNIKARSAELNESKLNYIKKSRDIEENLVRTFFNTVTARSLIDSTWAELQAAAESRNISVIRLKAGIGTFIDVLQAQSTYTSANINHLTAVVGYDISQVELLFEMGVISVNNILEGFNSDSGGTTK